MSNGRMMWEPHEIEFIKKHYYDYGPTACARALGRTKWSVFSKAQRIGLSCNKAILGRPKKIRWPIQ